MKVFWRGMIQDRILVRSDKEGNLSSDRPELKAVDTVGNYSK